MRAKRSGLVTALACVLMLAGCVKPAQTDASGAIENDALEMTIEEQYEVAGVRHQELNERFAELQAEVFKDKWREGGTHSEVIPWQGGVRGNDLPGSTDDNSYYFSVSRWYVTDEPLRPFLEKTTQLWEGRDWEVGQEIYENGVMRITTTTPDGFWFALEEQRGQLELTGFSPVYWGERRALSRAIAERRNGQDEVGAHWDTTDLDEKGQSYQVPGVFRPFPAWNAEH